MQGTPQRKHRKGPCVQWPRRELGAGTRTFPAGPWRLRGLSQEPVKATPPPLGPEAREVSVHKQSSPRASFSHPAQPPERLGPAPAWPVASLLLRGYHPQPGLPARAPASPPAELLDHQISSCSGSPVSFLPSSLPQPHLQTGLASQDLWGGNLGAFALRGLSRHKSGDLQSRGDSILPPAFTWSSSQVSLGPGRQGSPLGVVPWDKGSLENDTPPLPGCSPNASAWEIWEGRCQLSLSPGPAPFSFSACWGPAFTKHLPLAQDSSGPMMRLGAGGRGGERGENSILYIWFGVKQLVVHSGSARYRRNVLSSGAGGS